ncbi:MAG: MupA/Atu3671 family FMN-dependent luciferase-like monooxygenase [Gemmataceae bacterium]
MTEPKFRVVTHPTGRQALWPAARTLPAGWTEALAATTKEAALAHVTQQWTGFRPRRAASPALTPATTGQTTSAPRRKTVDFSLMFFGSDEGHAASEKYEMVISAAKFADQNGFSALWVPERHFTRMGSLYPNPAVLQAAVARETKRLKLRSASVVLPLHNPIRIVEEWSCVDNLSHGRIEISFAPGWNPGDFLFYPERYADRYDITYKGLDHIRSLWAGEMVDAVDGEGKAIRVRTYPTPVQKDLTIWMTCAGSERSFQAAGKHGCHLLTHLFDQDVETLAKKIKLYREARAAAGYDPATGRVAVTLHTYLGDTLADVQKAVRGPYADYLRENMGLLEKLAASRGLAIDLKRLGADEMAMAIDWLFEKFLRKRSLMGTPDSCAELVEQLIEVDVQDIACLIDFGPSAQAILDSLPLLGKLADRFR